MTYEIDYLESVVREDIPALPKVVKERVRREIERKLMTKPIEFGKPLRYSLKGCRRIRVGDHRVVYVIDGARVTVVKIGHRCVPLREVPTDLQRSLADIGVSSAASSSHGAVKSASAPGPRL